MWVGLTLSVEDLEHEDWGFPEKEAFGLKTATQKPCLFPDFCPAEFGFSSPPNHVSQIPKIKLPSLWNACSFCFCREPCLLKQESQGQGSPKINCGPAQGGCPTQVPVEAAKPQVPGLGGPSVLPTPTLATTIPGHQLSSLLPPHLGAFVCRPLSALSPGFQGPSSVPGPVPSSIPAPGSQEQNL